jgi:CRISPR system Cascade subunit CasA
MTINLRTLRQFGASPSAAALVLLLAGGCAHYAPRPIDAAGFAAEFDARKLERPPESPGTPWSDADLLTAALAHAPALSQAAAAYRSAEAAARSARVPPAAAMTLTAEYSKDADAAKPWLYGVATDIPLDLGARRNQRIGAARISALQARYDYAEVVWSVRSALRHAHVERLAADRELALAERLVALRRDRADKLALRLKVGEDAWPAAVTARQDLAAAERRRDDASARRAQAEVALAKALGVAPAAVRDLPLAPLPSSPPPPDPPILAAWRSQAALSSNGVLKALADYDLAENRLRLEVAKQYPDVHVGPGYIWERGLNKYPFDLALMLPPRDLNRAGIAEAEARRAEAGRRLEAVQAEVLSVVDQSVAGLVAAEAALRRAQDEDLPLARGLAEAAQRGLRAGDLDRVDQIAAEAAAVEAELAQLDSWRQAWTAQANLEDAVRRTEDPAEVAVLKAAVDHLKEPG